MKILLVNSYDRGGAANACIRLHDGLIRTKIDSKALLIDKSYRTKELYSYHENHRSNSVSVKKSFSYILKRKIKKILIEFKILKKSVVYDKERLKNELFLNQRNKKLEMYSFPNSNFDITTCKVYEEADIINLHWVANFLDYKSFFKKCNKPVIWTLHDMNPFTGGEHYTEIYSDIDENGKPLKRTLTKDEIKMFEDVLHQKKEALDGFDNLHIVVLCNWMANEVKKSELFSRFPITIIPNGIDSKIFKARDRQFSREILNIPLDKTVILFVSDSIENYRKGYIYLLKAFEKLKKNNIVLCAVGQKTTSLINSSKIIELGAIYDERLMSMIYSAADVFVIPSLMDNLPNTVIESLMCGTPVIGFPVGGMTDLIQNGENGYLTDDISTDDLLNKINLFIENPDIFDRNNIAKTACEKYDIDLMSKNYIELYKKILNLQA